MSREISLRLGVIEKDGSYHPYASLVFSKGGVPEDQKVLLSPSKYGGKATRKEAEILIEAIRLAAIERIKVIVENSGG